MGFFTFGHSRAGCKLQAQWFGEGDSPMCGDAVGRIPQTGAPLQCDHKGRSLNFCGINVMLLLTVTELHGKQTSGLFQRWIYIAKCFTSIGNIVMLSTVWVRREGFIGSCWGNRREGDHWGDLGVDGWIILRWISRRWDVGVWTGLGWPRIETGGGRL